MKTGVWILAVVALLGGSGNVFSNDGGSLVAAAESPDSEAVSTTDAQAGVESFEFQAEVNRLMDIIINSLYKSKEIFLREVISNASDALDKLRFMAVSDDAALKSGPEELRIRISADKEARTLTIADTGVGMTKADLIQNLGTVAKSGTTNFVEALGETGDLSLIGQFGVGFYSIYLVADKVQVYSKHNDDVQHIWESTADSVFTVREDPRGDTLGRGTEIVLHLKEDADEFLDPHRLSELIHRYSEFITFPIYQLKEVEREEAVEDDETTEEVEDLDAETTDDEDEEEDDAATDADKATPAKTRTVKVNEWERVNTNQAIWARSSKDITDDEYQAFYKSISKDSSNAATWTHFKAEGDVEFKSILYIPEKAGYDVYNKFYETSANLKLYVRKVLITDDFAGDLMPRYLNFISGVVDSDALPLNVSRETLQQHKALKVIGKKLVKKAIDMLTKLAADSESKPSDTDGGADAEDKKEVDQASNKYLQFYEQFGRHIKMGVIEDQANKTKLQKLLRFKTSSSDGKWVSLAEYAGRMPDWQKDIFYLSGDSIEALEKSPFLEKLKAKGVEVIFVTDVADEYVMAHTSQYDGKKVIAASKEGVKVGNEDAKQVAALDKHYSEQFKPLIDYLKKLYGSKITRVKIGEHATSAPCLIVVPQYAQTARMDRFVASQTFADSGAPKFSQKIMELNPRHPIVAKLNELVSDDADAATKEAADQAWLLYDAASAAGGFHMDFDDAFTQRMYRVIGSSLGTESLELLAEADVEVEEEEATPAADAAPQSGDGEAPFDMSSFNMEEIMANSNNGFATPPEAEDDDKYDEL